MSFATQPSDRPLTFLGYIHKGDPRYALTTPSTTLLFHRTMLYSKLATPAIALVAATSAAAVVTRSVARQDNYALPKACTDVCAPLDVLGTLDCEMTAPGCEHCSILQGILIEIRDCYICQLENDAPTTPAEIQESMDAIAAQCAETQDVVFEAPDIVGAFPAESQSDGDQEPTSSGPTDSESPEPTGEPPADDDNQDGENDDDQGAAVRGIVSVGTLGLGVALTSLLL